MNMPRGIYLRGYDSRNMPQGRDVDLKSIMLILINIIIIMAIITKIIMLITIIIAII